MFSFHPRKPGPNPKASAYGKGFRAVPDHAYDIHRMCRGVTRHVWSPCVWQDGVRTQEHFLSASWIVLDFDSGEMSLDEAVSSFCDMVHWIGTTRNHQKDKGGIVCDRFRVALRSDVPYWDLRAYRYKMTEMMRKYPVDKSCKDGARLFFPCREIVQVSEDGYTEEVPDEIPEAFERIDPLRWEAYKRTGILPTKVRARLTTVVPVGWRNTTWFGLAKDLGLLGYAPEEIEAMIVGSQTYVGQTVTAALREEIRHCVTSGLRSLRIQTHEQRR